MNYRFRMSQEELQHIYKTAKHRKEAHADKADEFQKKIDECVIYSTEKEALKEALDQIAEKDTDVQIFVGVERDQKTYRINNKWLVTDKGETKQAADYLGFALMYDGTRLLNIIDNNVNIDDVVSYY